MFLSFFIQAAGYMRFSRRLKITGSPVSEEIAVPGFISKKKLPVFTNRFIAAPMLIGLFRPRIILPDSGFTHEQLGNIFMHELTHLRRCDIAVKWITVAVTSIHWFNPMMYFLKRDLSRACELSCDEAVIKSMDRSAKQSYGETLIALAAEHNEPAGVLFTTMYEEKRTLKERLSAIMKYKRTKHITAASVFASILILLCTFSS